MNKKILVILFLCLLIIILSYLFFFKGEYDFADLPQKKEPSFPEHLDLEKVYTIDDIFLSFSSNVWLIGQYSGPEINTSNTPSFSMTEGARSLDMVLEALQDSIVISQGDYLLLEGKYDSATFTSFNIENLYKLSEEDYEDLLFKRLPAVEMNIMQESLDVNHGCENLVVDVKIKNIGEFPIEYSHSTSEATRYAFFAVVNNERIALFPNDEGYGFEDFGLLDIGGEKIVPFGLDSENVFCKEDKEGEFTGILRVDFGNVKKQDRGMKVGLKYNLLNLSSSNEVNVKVKTCKCLLD